MSAPWQSRPLGDVTTFFNGLWKGEKPPYVTVGVIRNTNFAKDGSIDDSDIAFMEVEARKFANRKLEYGDIILEKSGGGPKQPVGRVVLFDKQDGAYSFSNFTSAIRVRDQKELDFRFLHKFLFWKYASGITEGMQSHSTGIRNLNADAYKAIEVPLPPLTEQQRIVASLNEAFAGLATMTANAEKNLKNARELFESVSKSLLRPRNEDWERLNLEALLERKWIVSHLDGNHGSAYPRKEEFVSSGVPYLSANCLEEDRVDMSLAKYLSPERAGLLRKGVAQNNDVLFAHNATVGPVAMLYTDVAKVILSTSLTYYRCDPDHIIPEYLAHYMRSPEFKSQYKGVMRQSTRNQVPITKQREFFHVIPPLDEQRMIATKLDALRDEIRRLDAIYRQRLGYAADLKKSILQKAFCGELKVPPSRVMEEAAE